MWSKRTLTAVLPLCIAVTMATLALAADTTWTLHDLDIVAAAATAALADQKVKSTQISMRVKLAEALAKADATAQAKDVLVAAAVLLDAPTDFTSSMPRRDIIRDMIQLGDMNQAEALANVDAPPSVKASLLGELGAGQARVGAISVARQLAERIIKLGPSADPAFGRAFITIAGKHWRGRCRRRCNRRRFAHRRQYSGQNWIIADCRSCSGYNLPFDETRSGTRTC